MIRQVNHVDLDQDLKNRDWHVILGHPSDQYLKKFFELKNIKVSKIDFSERCEICKSCKIQRKSHSNSLPISTIPFERLHFDLLEIKPVSNQNFRYVLGIVDNCSRFNRIYCLNKKSDSQEKIIEFLNELKNKLDKYPAYLHTDRGGEFLTKTLLKYCKERGIVFELGPANSPQTNGIAERFNQSLLTKIRCLLAQTTLPISFWNEAAKYGSMLLNLLPTRTLNWKTPVSVLINKDQNIEPVRKFKFLVPFGLKVHVHHHPPSKHLYTTI